MTKQVSFLKRIWNKLDLRLTLLVLLFSILPLIILGVFAFNRSQQVLEQQHFDHLNAVAMLKGEEINRWVRNNVQQLNALTQRPQLRENVELLTAEGTAVTDAQLAHDNLLIDHLVPKLANEDGFWELFLLDAADGQILVSTNEDNEGQNRHSEPYFVEGQKAAYVQNVYLALSLGQPAMTIGTPVRNRQDEVVAVLAGRLDLAELSEIAQQTNELTDSEDTYFVNQFNFFVTDPRFGENYTLNETVHTEGVTRCLQQENGQGIYENYRGTAVLGAYRWLPQRELCVITEIDQDEALVTINELRRSFLIVGAFAAVGIGLSGIFFTRSITAPLHNLTRGLERVGHGDLNHQIPVRGQDEIGQLTASFNRMTDDLRHSEAALKQLNETLEQRVVERTQALQESEERFRTAFEHAAVGRTITSLESRLTRVNQAFCQMTGYSEEELLNKTWREVTHPDFLEAIQSNMQQLTQGIAPSFNQELVIKNKKGTDVWIRLNVVLIRGADGQPLYYVGDIENITQRKEAEVGLKQTLEELERSNTDLQQFAYVASHDLQEPLRMVTSYLQLLQRRYGSHLDEDADEFINYAVDGANRMKQLIQDLLAFSRVGTRGNTFEVVNAKVIVQQALTNLQASIEETNASITYDSLPVVKADASQIEQLFQNLISNAIKFRGNDPPQVSIAAERCEDMWCFSVRDNGIGFDPQFGDRIFIIFQRLHTRAEYGGTGIGLAICKKIVERHGGRIWAESQPDAGTTFYFTVPMADDDEG